MFSFLYDIVNLVSMISYLQADSVYFPSLLDLQYITPRCHTPEILVSVTSKGFLYVRASSVIDNCKRLKCLLQTIMLQTSNQNQHSSTVYRKNKQDNIRVLY